MGSVRICDGASFREERLILAELGKMDVLKIKFGPLRCLFGPFHPFSVFIATRFLVVYITV